jgi:hypothetical protein
MGVARNFYLVKIIFLAKLGCYTLSQRKTIQPCCITESATTVRKLSYLLRSVLQRLLVVFANVLYLNIGKKFFLLFWVLMLFLNPSYH